VSLAICIVASEAAPLAKTGGLADVTGALVKFLHADGHDVRLFMPFYSSIDRTKLEAFRVEFLQDVAVQVGARTLRYDVWTARLPGSRAFVYLVDCPELYARSKLYTQDADEHVRFIALTRAAFQCCQRMGWSPQIMHFNDWHTGFGPLYLAHGYSWDALFRDARSVLTIHNIGYQGIFPASAVGDVGLGDRTSLLHQEDLRAGRINSLKHGVMYANAITTVSPTYAREIQTPRYGMGLEETLRRRSDALVGILNGVDYDDWDPRWDRYLTHAYGPGDLEGKRALRAEFVARLGLEAPPDVPLVGMVTRLASQKGIDLLFDALPHLFETRRFAMVVLGSGDAPYEHFFEHLATRWPARVAFRQGYSEEFAHWVEAASDMFLMPSQYEPCGLNQMYSLRYGTVPIVRRTGGLADSVEHYNPVNHRGTGIVFNDFDAPAVQWALGTAFDLFAQPQHWQRLMKNGMAKDFSWERQGAEYVKLYEKLLGGGGAGGAGVTGIR